MNSGFHTPGRRALVAILFLGWSCILLSLAGCAALHKSTAAKTNKTSAAAAGTRVDPGTPAANAKLTASARVGPVPTGNSVPTTPTAAMKGSLKETRVGEVRVLGGGRRFVLIEIANRTDLPVLSPGMELHARLPTGSIAYAGEETATLRISPERRQPFIVADVVSGDPHVDDPVYLSPGAPVSSFIPAALQETFNQPPAAPTIPVPPPPVPATAPGSAARTVTNTGSDGTSKWHATATVHDN